MVVSPHKSFIIPAFYSLFVGSNNEKIQCPNGNTQISIDAVLTHQIEEKIKKEFEATQKIKEYEALKAVNKELIALYWHIGQMIVERQQKKLQKQLPAPELIAKLLGGI